MTSPLCRTGLCLVMTLLCTGPAIGQEKHAIGLNIKAGQSWEFSQGLDSTMSIKSSGGGQVQNMENAMIQRRVGAITIREIANGRPSVITVVYGKECMSSLKMNGQEQSPPFALAGQTVTLTMAADGSVTHDFKGNLEPQFEGELKQLIQFDQSLNPTQPVAVGEEWVPQAAKLKEQLQLAPADKLDVKCKLLKVGEIRGTKTYDISLTGAVTKAEGGMQVSVRISGVIQLDTGSGLPMQSDLVVQIGINGNQQGAGPDGVPIAVTVNGNGQVKMVGSAIPKEGFAGPVAVGSGPGPGPNPLDPQPQPQPNPLDPQPQPNPQPNPLDPQPNPLGPKPKNPLAGEEESPFTGSFKGRQLSADFKITGGKMTGSIKLGPKSFPATGAVEGGKLTGAFEADGAKFDFVATLEGTTLSLDSEGNKYTLQKDAAAAPAKPKNPLE